MIQGLYDTQNYARWPCGKRIASSLLPRAPTPHRLHRACRNNEVQFSPGGLYQHLVPVDDGARGVSRAAANPTASAAPRHRSFNRAISFVGVSYCRLNLK